MNSSLPSPLSLQTQGQLPTPSPPSLRIQTHPSEGHKEENCTLAFMCLTYVLEGHGRPSAAYSCLKSFILGAAPW